MKVEKSFLENEYNSQEHKRSAEAPARKRRWLIGITLGLILLLAAFLRFYELGTTGVGNTYYAATVKSMLTSWKNFFFASFEPGGSVTVDKPPLGFWIQAISAYFLGVNGFALALPQALAGVLSVPLLFYLVKRQFGDGAGLIAALSLTILPSAIATERNNTMDGLLVFVLLLAAWAFLESVRRGRFRYILLGAFIVGLGFNIKMLQAFMPLPAFYALYLFGAPHKWWKRIAHLVAASVLLVVVSLAWAVAVDLTPAEDRPYVGSSETNSMLELILGHNGIKRLTSESMAGTDGPAGMAVPGDGQSPMPPFPGDGTDDLRPPFPLDGGDGGMVGQAPPNPPRALPSDGKPVGGLPPLPGGGNQIQQLPPPDGMGNLRPTGDGLVDGGQRTPFSQEVGRAGVLRLFSEPLADEASWLLPVALLGLPVLIFVLGWKWPLDAKQLGVILWAGWLIPELLYFSFTTGLFHAYYVIMLGSPMAALVGAAAWALHKLHKQRPWVGWILIGLLSAATLLVQAITLLSFPSYAAVIIPSSILLWLAGCILLAMQSWENARKVGYALMVAAVAIAPLVWSFATTLNTNPNTGLPNAGPASQDSPRPMQSGELSTDQEIILEYLLANTDADTYLMATTSSHSASPFILATGRPVLTFGGFNGRDDVISVEQLTEMVANRELRFVLADDSLQQQKPEIASWVQRNCSVVSLPGMLQNQPRMGQGIPPEQAGQSSQLFDCGSSWVLQETGNDHTQ
ncbi:MAG: glycosyltransferase family 39 protein [Anaerolineales bacterium]|jgi:4-amino-4-deoxy-L-arabinose transferase-like glycosyltransferase